MIKPIALSLILFSTASYANIYSYTAKDGHVYYVNYRPTGLSSTEYNLFKFVSASAWDTLTKYAGKLVSNRATVKAIVKTDLLPMARITANEFGGVEVLPKLPNGDCMVLKGIDIYDALQVFNGTAQCSWL